MIEDAIRELTDAVEELRKQSEGQRWIPVTELLPEVGKMVVIYTHESAVTNRRVWVDCMVTSNRNPSPRWVGHNGRVLFWMPLPEPPEEET